MILVMAGLNILYHKKSFSKIETKKNIQINVFVMTFPIYILDQKLKNSMDLLNLISKNNLQNVYIKNFPERKKTKNTFEEVV